MWPVKNVERNRLFILRSMSEALVIVAATFALSVFN